MPVKKVAILTAGGLAPCLSSCIGALIERYTEVAPEIRIICYFGGYQGLLKGDSVEVTPEMRKNAFFLHQYGGSPIGNSRVKLSNVADCLKRGLIKEGQDPRQVVLINLSRMKLMFFIPLVVMIQTLLLLILLLIFRSTVII